MAKFTLCFDCANATGNCSWSSYGEPVDGWEAVQTKIHSSTSETDAYKVIYCPLFVRDAYDGGLKRIGSEKSDKSKTRSI